MTSSVSVIHDVDGKVCLRNKEPFNFYFCFEVFHSLLQASNKRANVVARPDSLTDVLTASLDECLKIQLKVLAFCNFPCLCYSSKQSVIYESEFPNTCEV
uniref:Uncharacterized protein n=1 Tax=Glossina palpalis gambiensis TaxID=67801 RepID=A0A1B0BSY6_9MUSC